MRPRDRKRAFLQELSQESEPVSIPKLLEKTRLKYADRTVRRWLHELVEEGLVQKSGTTKDAKYIATKPTGEIADQVSSVFGSQSLKVIKRVKQPIHQRHPVAYNEDWFDSYKPGISFYLSPPIRTQLKKAGRRANNHDPAGTYAHQIFNRLLIDLSYNSSRLEGCTYSLLDTERLLMHGDTPEGKLEEEKMMILNHKEAIRFLVEQAPRVVINEETVSTLHYLLSDGLVEPRYAGKVRDHAVRIGGSAYMPFEDPKRLKLQLKKIAKKAAEIEDPFEQSFFLLVHISYLQAFADVNKRTARLSANIPLIQQNYVPLSFNDVNVEDYMTSMISIYEFQDVHPLVDLYVYSYMRTCVAYDTTIKVMGVDEVRVRYRQQRRRVLGQIIAQKTTGNRLKSLVTQEAQKITSQEDRESFIEDVWEDLELMDESRIVGLGITREQLKVWLALKNKVERKK